MPNVRGPSGDHPSAVGSKPDRDQRAAVHRRPEVPRQRPAEQYRRRHVAPNSSRASHNAIRDANPSPADTTAPMPALASTWSLRTRRLRPRQSRPAHGKSFSAWSFLLPNPTTRRTHAAIRSDIARTTGAAGQRGKQTDAGEHGRPSVIHRSHQQLLNDCSVMQLFFCWANHARHGKAAGKCRQNGARTTLLNARSIADAPERRPHAAAKRSTGTAR